MTVQVIEIGGSSVAIGDVSGGDGGAATATVDPHGRVRRLGRGHLPVERHQHRRHRRRHLHRHRRPVGHHRQLGDSGDTGDASANPTAVNTAILGSAVAVSGPAVSGDTGDTGDTGDATATGTADSTANTGANSEADVGLG